MIDNYLLFKDLPTIDLHGLDRVSARINTTEFINDNYKMGNNLLIVVHGKGLGILRNEVLNILKSNPLVLSYKTDYFNNGATIVELKKLR